MSIVPLLTDNDRTLASTRDDFAAAGGADGSAVLILKMDTEQLLGQSSNASYDLRVGKEYMEHRDIQKHALPSDETITLLPGMAVIIETEEYVHLPRTLFALVVPKVGLLQQGLSNTMSKVDPGYEGHLLVTLFNLGQETVELQRRAAFCSLCVLRVEKGARLYGKPGKSIPTQTKRPWWQPPLDYLGRNLPVLTALNLLMAIGSILVTIGLGVVTALLYLAQIHGD